MSYLNILLFLLIGIGFGIENSSAQDLAQQAKLIFFYGNSPNLNASYEVADADKILNHPKFNRDHRTVLYLHGFVESPASTTVQLIVNAYIKRGTYNILVLDWSSLVNGSYVTAVENAYEIGPTIAEILIDLFKKGINRLQFHLVGHSLGGQLAGIIGRSTIQHHGMENLAKQSPTPSVTSMPEKFGSSGDAIYDSNAESSGASSSESDSPSQTNTENLAEQQSFGQGSSKKFLRIVDRITASNLFQSAAEIPYIQKAMENMNTKIRLRVELKGLVGRCTLNIPPPPSDRIWVGFRGPPRLWISATPALGDHTFDWTIVTNAIESKLCEEVSKYLVYPNMVDMIAPFLGHSTYRE